MDKSVLWKLSYGMYAIGTLDEERPTGCIVNTVVQITNEEAPIIAVSMNKNNFTYEAIKATGKFSVSIISEKTNQNVIAKLGFTSGRDTDKFTGFEFMYFDALPVVKENVCGYIAVDVVHMQETKTHFVILGRVSNAMKGIDFPPMTYQYYHDVIKGKAPKNAPTYREEVITDKYVCGVCGYIYEGDIEKEADDFVCPICQQPKSQFKKQS
ncbi:flavin reductase [Anaerosinus massiliensis]|uniref:flavin reductase n=1 Tax=Massilibacillus massiliensis TaxID=1806837 RepID=UPI000AD5443B|nr:flavin reductase [Massilibacillus massiliensis]